MTLTRAEVGPPGMLYLTVRDGTDVAIGVIEIAQPVSGHYTNGEGTRANIGLPGPPGPDSLHLVIDEFSEGTEFVADVTVDSEFVAGVSEVRGTAQGLARFGDPPGTLVPFTLDF